MTGRGDVTVRRLGGDDWAVLRDLRLAALIESPRAFLGELRLEQDRSESDWRAVAGQGVWFVAHPPAGPPAGLVHCVFDPGTGDWYLESLWVAPDRRGQGLAATLLDCADPLARADERAATFLWILDGNEATRAFYLNRGFVATGRRQPIGPGRQRVEEQFRRPLPAGARPGSGGGVRSKGPFAAR